jgi:hypothetical protein
MSSATEAVSASSAMLPLVTAQTVASSVGSEDRFRACKDRVLLPYSPEWFAAMRLCDPVKAAQTKFDVEDTGREEVRSICGDDPARDNRLEKSLLPAGGADTPRLCEDCLDIRRAMGEPFEAIYLLRRRQLSADQNYHAALRQA